MQDTQKLWDSYTASRSDYDRGELTLLYMSLVERLAKKMAKGLPSQVDVNDLISDGTLGLIDAIEKFEPERNLKFETYAPRRITGAIYDGLRKMDWVPRTVRAQARLVKDTRTVLATRLQRLPTDQEMADELGWEIEQVRLALEMPQSETMAGLDEPIKSPDDAPPSLAETLSDGSDVPADMMNMDIMKKRLLVAFSQLSEKEQTILSLYYNEGLRFHEISTLNGSSESRICQIHVQAIEKMRVILLAGE